MCINICYDMLFGTERQAEHQDNYLIPLIRKMVKVKRPIPAEARNSVSEKAKTIQPVIMH